MIKEIFGNADASGADTEGNNAGFLKYISGDSSYVALLVIDVQAEFCDPGGKWGNSGTDKISGDIARIVPHFRGIGITVYPVYYAQYTGQGPEDTDFYRFSPEHQDIPVAKYDDCAFRGSRIQSVLEANKHKYLLVCGFNMSSCVMETVLAAQALGFDVTLLTDLTGEGNSRPFKQDSVCDMEDMLNDYRENRVRLLSSSTVLEVLGNPERTSRPGICCSP